MHFKKINFDDEKDMQYFMNEFGGEERVKKYERIMNAILKAKDKARLDIEFKKSADTEFDLTDLVYFPAIHYDKESEKLVVYFAATYIEIPQMMYFVIKIKNTDQMLLKEIHVDPIKVTNFISVAEIIEKLTLPDIYIVSIMAVVTKPSGELSCMITDEEKYDCLSTNPAFIERALIDAPKKNTDAATQILQEDHKIRAFYNRYPFRKTEVDVDYVYENAYDENKGLVHVKLDGSGSASLSPAVKKETFKEVYKMAIMDFKQGAVQYASKDASMNFRNQKLVWLFKQDWGVSVSSNLFKADSSVELTYKLGFCYTVNPNVETLYISSLITEDLGNTCRKIRKFNPAIGCVKKGTHVLMADGSEKMIEDIMVGDKIRTRFGYGEVENTWVGNTNKLICLHTQNNHILFLTKFHYVYTEQGVMKADEITMQSKILMEDKSFSPLRYLYSIDGEESVYNLSVSNTEDGTMICENMVIADNDFQPVEKESITRPNDQSFILDIQELLRVKEFEIVVKRV